LRAPERWALPASQHLLQFHDPAPLVVGKTKDGRRTRLALSPLPVQKADFNEQL